MTENQKDPSPNVTLAKAPAPPKPPEVREPTFIRCFLCGSQLEVRDSKRKKPYFICDPCGLQVFVRKQRGISLLGRKTTPIRKTGNGVLDLLSQLEQVNSKLSDIRDDKPWFSENPELNLAAKALKAEKAKLLKLLRAERPKSRKGAKEVRYGKPR
jgi:hypothetical protein